MAAEAHTSTSFMETDERAHLMFSEAFANDGDIILLSRDNIRFPVSSAMLKRTSGWFKTALSLPQTPQPQDSTPEPLPMGETAEVLASLLSLTSGLGFPTLDDLAHLDDVLAAADKYEMPMPIALIRALLPPHISLNPVRAYGMASRMDWVPERAQAAAASCGVNLLAPTHARELARLEGPHFEALLGLHERRRAALARALESTGTFVANVKGMRCRGPGMDVACGELVDHTTWGAFKFACMKEPWRCVALEGAGGSAGHMPGLKELLEDKCPKCGRGLYSVLDTLRNLATIVSSLPKSVDAEEDIQVR